MSHAAGGQFLAQDRNVWEEKSLGNEKEVSYGSSLYLFCAS